MSTASCTASPARITFKTSPLASGDGSRAWGHLETAHARVGVMLQRAPQPHLTFYPPVRVTDDGADAFLEACLAHVRAGDEAWGRLSVDPADGEVSMRENLVSDDGAEIERALDRAAAFFDGQHGELARACLGDGADGSESDRPGMKGLIGRLLGTQE